MSSSRVWALLPASGTSGSPGRVNTRKINRSRGHESPAKHTEGYGHFETACALDKLLWKLESPALRKAEALFHRGIRRGTGYHVIRSACICDVRTETHGLL